MIDWAGRIDALNHKLKAEFSVDDPLVVDMLLAALIDCPYLASTWICLETNWYSRDAQDAWFSFGESWTPISLSRLRARSPWRDTEAEMLEMIESPSQERLLVECDYERYPYFNRLTQALYFLDKSLRVRTRSSRTGASLRYLDKFNRDRQADQLAALTRDILEDPAGDRPERAPEFVAPENFLYHIELVERCSPWYRDWNILLEGFGLLAARRAWLYGRETTDDSDLKAIARVARDSIPPWISKALALLLEGPAQSGPLEKVMGLEDSTRRSGHGPHRELVRLRRAGIVHWSSQRMRWSLEEAHRAGIRELLAGRAFSASGQLSAA